MTSTSRFADATSTLQVGQACGRNICNPDWGNEPTSSTLLAGHAWRPKVEDTGVGGKKHPIDLSGTDESDVPLKRQHVANPMTYDGVGKKHVYIVKNYTPDQKGEDIWHGDVVRPSNHRWCIQGDDEVRKWSLKSTARCPTYGTCQSCYMCGPVGKRCIDCYDQEDPNPSGFVIMMDGKKILDSITIATILGQGQEIAKADRILNLHAIKMERFNSDRIWCAVQHVYKHHPERTTKEKLRRNTTLKLYNLVN